MDIYFVNIISDIIKRENKTFNIVFSLHRNNPSMEEIALKHSTILYKLHGSLALFKYNMEIDEPIETYPYCKEILLSLIDDIKTYCNYQKNQSPNIQNLIIDLISIKADLIKILTSSSVDLSRETDLTLTELAEFNGRDGKPAYVAVNGIIYDVTNIGNWSNGVHFGLTPGQDLTNSFSSCHNMNTEVLSKMPIVGKIKK